MNAANHDSGACTPRHLLSAIPSKTFRKMFEPMRRISRARRWGAGTFRSDDGNSLIEFALVAPALLLVVTGIASFGLYFNHLLMLTNAVQVGAESLAISRGQTTDPCSTFVTAAEATAPYLNPSSLSFSYVLNGTSYSGTSCSSTSTTTGAAGNLIQGANATVTVTYPCSLAVYGVNLLPGCTLTVKSTELIQ
jgi:Flp pilus assembly protein TadG